MDASNIGKNLSKIMKDLELSQVDLAEKTGITQAGISQIVNGQREPSLDSLIKILKVIPVTFERLARD